jgi:hypothetical protein
MTGRATAARDAAIKAASVLDHERGKHGAARNAAVAETSMSEVATLHAKLRSAHENTRATEMRANADAMQASQDLGDYVVTDSGYRLWSKYLLSRLSQRGFSNAAAR